jgi:hypothetical protein
MALFHADGTFDDFTSLTCQVQDGAYHCQDLTDALDNAALDQMVILKEPIGNPAHCRWNATAQWSPAS